MWLQYRNRVSPHAAASFWRHYITRLQRVSKKHCSLTVFLLIPCYTAIISCTREKRSQKMRFFLMLREADHVLIDMTKHEKNFCFDLISKNAYLEMAYDQHFGVWTKSVKLFKWCQIFWCSIDECDLLIISITAIFMACTYYSCNFPIPDLQAYSALFSAIFRLLNPRKFCLCSRSPASKNVLFP